MAAPKNDTLIPRRKALRDNLGMSNQKGTRLEREDPLFPPSYLVGGRWYKKLSEINAYIAQAPPRSEANAHVTHRPLIPRRALRKRKVAA